MLVLLNKNIILIFTIGIFILMTLSSCEFAEITDLIHKDTEEIKIGEGGEEFLNQKFDQYQINKILFFPYTRQNPFESYEDKYYHYSLRLAAYRQHNTGKVMINRVIVEGIKDLNFKKLAIPLKRELIFSKDKKNNIQSSEIILIDEINNYNMELTDKSQLKVILNVSVEENGKTTTRDLEYIFETKTRKYLVQP